MPSLPWWCLARGVALRNGVVPPLPHPSLYHYYFLSTLLPYLQPLLHPLTFSLLPPPKRLPGKDLRHGWDWERHDDDQIDFFRSQQLASETESVGVRAPRKRDSQQSALRTSGDDGRLKRKRSSVSRKSWAARREAVLALPCLALPTTTEVLCQLFRAQCRVQVALPAHPCAFGRREEGAWRVPVEGTRRRSGVSRRGYHASVLLFLLLRLPLLLLLGAEPRSPAGGTVRSRSTPCLLSFPLGTVELSPPVSGRTPGAAFSLTKMATELCPR